jgi:3-dehydroquinate synthase
MKKRAAPAAASITVTVDLHERSYPIIIGHGTLEQIGPLVAAKLKARRAAVVTNPIVGKLYGRRVATSLQQAGCEVVSVQIPDGEEHKNLASLSRVYDRLLRQRIDRDSPIIALGGGIIGDLTGFAAATLLRGIPYAQVPTTLLAQVDSSVGGKTGINHPSGKNLIGAFYQPRLVLIDVGTLQTLPRREVLAGLVEVIKYGVILDPNLFALIERDLDRIIALDSDLLRDVVAQCCRLKAMVVARDEREADYRSILNFGHTLGHAVESLTAYKRYLHGEAVAIGMAFALQLSTIRGYCERATMQRVIELLKRAGLPVEIPPKLRGEQLASAIESDKKMASGKVKFVCLERLGQTRFEYLTSEEIAAVAAQYINVGGQ